MLSDTDSFLLGCQFFEIILNLVDSLLCQIEFMWVPAMFQLNFKTPLIDILEQPVLNAIVLNCAHFIMSSSQHNDWFLFILFVFMNLHFFH